MAAPKENIGGRVPADRVCTPDRRHRRVIYDIVTELFNEKSPTTGTATMKPSDLIDRQYLEMRGKILSLAADFDRIARASSTDSPPHPKVAELKACVQLLLTNSTHLAEQIQLRLSDTAGDPRKRQHS